MDKARLYALETISAVFNKREYSQIAVNNLLSKKRDMDPRSEALYTQLVYGVLENKLLLDHYLAPYIKGKVLKEWVRHLLEMSVYQLVFLDRIPEYAVTSDAVEIARYKESEGASRLVNGILRTFKKDELNPLKPSEEHIKYSMNEWLYKQIKGQYKENYLEILKAFSSRAVAHARVNTIKTTREKVLKDNPNIMKSNNVLSGVIYKRGSIIKSDEFINGLVTVQDEASQMVSYFLNPDMSDKIIDLCAAPGGKTCHLAALMKNNGKIVANDIHQHKLKLIEENVKRLGVKNVTITNHDALKLRKIYLKGEFDKVLLDAPCSGFGVIKRKPEIRYFANEESVNEIVKLQSDLLDSAAYLVKLGGILVYSTCTINKGENEAQVKAFLKRDDSFELVEEKLVLPSDKGSDGFYMAKLKKVGKK